MDGMQSVRSSAVGIANAIDLEQYVRDPVDRHLHCSFVYRELTLLHVRQQTRTSPQIQLCLNGHGECLSRMPAARETRCTKLVSVFA